MLACNKFESSLIKLFIKSMFEPDKEFLLNEISLLKERSLNENYINYTIIKNDNEINIFFDKRNFFLIGWQIVDIYQNLNPLDFRKL